jgi:hypothetical protein
MRKIGLTQVVEKLNKDSVSVDEQSLREFDEAIRAMAEWRLQVEKIRISSGGKLPSSGLLVIGSGMYDSLEVGTKQAIVHCIQERLLRRKG